MRTSSFSIHEIFHLCKGNLMFFMKLPGRGDAYA